MNKPDPGQHASLRNPNAARKPKPRLANIQVLRGVAALSVVCAHAVDQTISYEPDNGITRLGHIDNLGAIGVDIFFIISGFVMAYSVDGKSGQRAAQDFIALRWIRIAPPYLIATVITMLATAVAGHSPNWRGALNAVTFVPLFETNAYTPPPIYVGWTLSFEFTFYLYIAAMVSLQIASRLWVLIPIFLTAGIVHFVLPAHTYYLLSWITNPIFVEFGLGIAAFYLWRNIMTHRKSLFVILGAVGLTAIAIQAILGYGSISESQYTLDGSLSFERVVYWGIPSFLMFCGAIALPEWNTGRMASVARKLGDASYSVYLIHPITLTIALYGLRHLPMRLPTIAIFVLTGAAGIAAGILFHNLVEKPLTRVLRSKYQSRSAMPKQKL